MVLQFNYKTNIQLVNMHSSEGIHRFNNSIVGLLTYSTSQGSWLESSHLGITTLDSQPPHLNKES